MISVIIPVYNEEPEIANTINRVFENDVDKLVHEIIVSDGGSTDNTDTAAAGAGARICRSVKKGRASQMNAGASMATGSILYFLHADTIPPPAFSTAITNCVTRNRKAGCFMLAFDHEHWFLRLHSWFTRFNIDAIRFGDQSLFLTKQLFEETGGFDESLIVMEDQELVKRIRKHSGFVVIKQRVLTSARKYVENGVYKTQLVFYLIFLMYQLGYSQRKLVQTYRRLLLQNKI